MPRSIDSGRMDWNSRKNKIIEIRLANSDSFGDYDLQDVHDDYVDWLKETPKAVDYDALAAADIDRADRDDRPKVNLQGTLWDSSDDCQIPYAPRKRRPLKKAEAIHFLGWQQIELRNYTNVTNAHLWTSEQITEVLMAFQQHPECRTFGDLRKVHEPPAAA